MDVSFTNVLEGARQYFQGLPSASAAAGPYYGQQNVQHEQQQQQNQQQINQLQRGQHQQHYYQQSNEHYADSSTAAAVSSNAGWMSQHTPSESSRTPSRERAPTQRPPSQSSGGSRPPSHSTQYQDISRPYHSPYPSQSQEHHVPASQPQQSSFQFTRPQSREIQQNAQHYQQQAIATNSTYHQPASPQSSRLPTREQLAHTMQSYQHPPGVAAHTPTHPQYNYQSRSYYPNTQAQPLAAKSEGTYMQPQSSQAMYYKQITPGQVASMPSKQNSYIMDNRKTETSMPSNAQYQPSVANDQSYRATHNLPPIAALSNYRPNKTGLVKETGKSALPRSKVLSSLNSYSTSVAQSINNSASIAYGNSRPESYSSTNSAYDMYNHVTNNNAQNQNNQRINPHVSSVITRTCSNVIMATSNTSHYSTPNNQNYNPAVPYQRAKAETQNYHKVQPNQNVNYQQPKSADSRTENIVNVPNTSVIKQRKEIPLDLSVKTVRTSADSTDGETSRNKYLQNKSQNVISSHSYPTLDVNSIERSLTQRSQLPTATAPKVEFHPNFNLSSRKTNWNPAKASQDPSTKRVYQDTTTHATMDYNNSTQASYQSDYLLKNRYPPSTISSIPQYAHHPYENHDISGKRPGQIQSPAIPTKMAKVENWRESINLQIEEKITSHVKQQQLQAQRQPSTHQHRVQSVLHRHKTFEDVARSSLANGQYPQANNHDSNYQKPPYSKPNSLFPQPKHSQSYVPSSIPHSGYYNNPKHTQSLYINPAARHNSATSVVPIAKPHIATGADKRVLSLLRNSIEIKEQKKIEQLKSQDLVISQRTDIQHPSTDVTAPLQPKPGIDRRNVSPFTPISVPDPNICKMPPKVLVLLEDTRIIPDLAVKVPNEDNTVIMNNSPSNDYDGLAAFLAARIRTKGELKELAHHQVINSNAARDARIQAFLEDTMKSPHRQNMLMSSSSSISSTSSQKPLKDKQAARKKLFTRNEEELVKASISTRDKSSIRSSSETSVFDFPDSDDENEMPVLERQTLDAMRRDRRNSLKLSTTPSHTMESDIKLDILESTSRAPSPEDDIFASICDTFMEQLRNKPTKRVKRTVESDPIVKLEFSEESTGEAIHPVKVKKEIKDDAILNYQEGGTPTDDLNIMPSSGDRSRLCDPDFEKCKTPIIIKNVFRSDSELSDNEIKSSECLMIRNRHRVRRKIISSSESETEEERVQVKVEKIETILDNKCDKSEGATDFIQVVTNLNIMETESKIQVKLEQPEEDNSSVEKSQGQFPIKSAAELLAIIRPAKKPSFGDGSDFYPGWEEGVYKYKKSLRMPPSLIQLTRPPMRLSTSLPDLDPCPQSPTTSITTDIESKDSLTYSKKEFKRFQSESVDSDSESTSSFNIFSKRTNYDSEGSSSIKSLPNTRKENLSILDKLLEKCGGRKKKKHKRKDDHSPKITPRADNPIELLATPTPSLAVSTMSPEKSKGLTSQVISATSAVLPFRKDTVNHFKDAFINSGNSILGVHDKFTTIVLSSRTRKETRAMKQRVTIKEVFGEDRPASAPPVTCVNECNASVPTLEPFSKNLQEIMVKREKLDNEDIRSILNRTAGKEDNSINNNNNLNRHSKELLAKDLLSLKIKKELEEEDEDENKKLIDLVIKKDLDVCSETMSLDSEEIGLTAKRKNKFGKMRRKFSSGFDYIRKKKKVKKEDPDNGSTEKKKKKIISAKTPESIDDIQKEIKNWVLNKGVGESHLHRAARLGYVDITAFCLDKMNNSPSPKDNAGYTPLHEACARGHLEIAKLLLKYGANVHEAAKGGIRPLHEAIENGFVEVVRLLLSFGADPSLATYAGLTPISLATDENMKTLLKDHLRDKAGEGGPSWPFRGPSSCFDPEESGYNVLSDTPLEDSDKELEDIEIDMSEGLLPNLYILREEAPTDRWVLLQDLSHFLKIKSRDALLRQISLPTGSNIKVNYKNVIKELKMSDFLEQAHCCQFLNMGEKINTRASKIALVKYTDRVKELLGIESAVISAR
ncbi:uncharacterized protein LOC109541408 [Dendroctonus ponderosae]|uniref:uncharacterized protein LOC109541408 n=1 Tax=Dendroctonus ponderosae TaxID=77166 RepID=UPI002034CB19|nr:uncharacterized protein LOC109541408 [Dendroctonus ponderosae]KAH1028405.1 hypothetical protein HUJ05_001759 [Dendroctonus ponderosae]